MNKTLQNDRWRQKKTVTMPEEDNVLNKIWEDSFRPNLVHNVDWMTKVFTCHSIKTCQFRDILPSQSLSIVLKKRNLTLQRKTCINKPNDTITQNKFLKTTTNFSHVLRCRAWKQIWPKFYTPRDGTGHGQCRRKINGQPPNPGSYRKWSQKLHSLQLQCIWLNTSARQTHKKQ